jgi:hypothetical protein
MQLRCFSCRLFALSACETGVGLSWLGQITFCWMRVVCIVVSPIESFRYGSAVFERAEGR